MFKQFNNPKEKSSNSIHLTNIHDSSLSWPGIDISSEVHLYIDVSEYRRGSQKFEIQRNWQHRVEITKKNKNTTQFVLDTTMHKQTQIT